MLRGGIARYLRPRGVSDEVLAAQLALLAQTSIIDVLIFAVGAAFVALGFAISGAASYSAALSWASIFAGFGAAGIFLSWRYRLAAGSEFGTVPPNISRWALWFAVQTACICLAWSSLVYLFWDAPSDTAILMLLGAALLGNIAVLTNFLPLRSAMIAAVIGINLPVMARLLTTMTADSFLIASVVLLVALVFHRAGLSANTTLTESLTLRFKNRELVERLRASLMDAEFANDAKSRFLTNISHQLRTPLNAVIGFAELMQQKVHGGIGDERYEEYIDDIAESSNQLLNMINDILDLSKLETDGIDLVEDEFDLGHAIDAALEMIRPFADERAIAIEVQPGAPYRISADRTRFKQILINLLSNAVKFSAPGQSVQIRWRTTPDNCLEILVEDNGVGMLPEEAHRVLKPFEQVDRADGCLGAAGLGLPLSKAFAELHGAALRLSSEPGHGTTAVVAWPRDRSIPDVREVPLSQAVG